MVRVVVALLCFFLGSGANADKRVALVIGNSAYRHTPELANPKNDAADVGMTLKKLGLQVIDGFDLDKAMLDRKIREFAAALQGADAGLFFYAGHGLQVSGQNYLVPIDAQLSNVAALETEAVRFEVVQRIMEAQTKQNILFFDACRNNPFARSLSRVAGGRSGDFLGLALQTFGVGTLVSFSAQPGMVASDGVGRNSPFAGPLVRLMGTSNDDLVTILMGVRREVLAATSGAQVPWNQDSLLDKIYLKHSIKTQPDPPQPRVQVAVTLERNTRRSIWVHNDSELLLLASGANRAFYYKQPSRALAEAGVKAGALLFEGRVEGQKYVGTAYRFSSTCPARSYSVEGPIKDDGRTVALAGQVRRLNPQTCGLLRAYKDELEFRYSRLE